MVFMEHWLTLQEQHKSSWKPSNQVGIGEIIEIINWNFLRF